MSKMHHKEYIIVAYLNSLLMMQFKHTITKNFNLKNITLSYEKYLCNLIILIKNYECDNNNYL